MARRSANGVSQNEFQNPLLVVLYNHSQKSAHSFSTAMHFETAVDKTCALVGINVNTFGTMTGGRSYAEYWVGNAFRSLKDSGYTDSVRKGWWSITQKGLDFVNNGNLTAATFTLRVLSQTVLSPETRTEESPSQTTEARVTETVTPAITPATMPFTMPVDETEMHAAIQAKPMLVLPSSYYEDAYLRGLAVVNTPCYGNFTNRSDECNKCLLSQSCREFFYQNLPMVAERIIGDNLKAEEAARKAAEAAAQAAANPAPATPAPQAQASDSGSGFVAKTTPVRVFCGVCRNAVEKDTLAYFRRGNGFVHDECRAKAK
jgi:hypothetical protein